MKTIGGFLASLALASSAAAAPRLYVVPSPTHEQTFAYGSERHQQWMIRGPDRHLALVAEFTNDPYVDLINIRQYDDFTFDFPAVRLGPDGRVFYFHAPNGHRVAVAERHRGFLGLDQVDLLPSCLLLIRSPHGYLSLSLIVREGWSVNLALL